MVQVPSRFNRGMKPLSFSLHPDVTKPAPTESESFEDYGLAITRIKLHYCIFSRNW